MRSRLSRLSCLSCLVCLAAACARDPLNSSRRYLASGDEYAQAGKFKEAAIEYRNAQKAAPNSAAPHLKLGELAMQSHDGQTAADEYVLAAALEPLNGTAQVRAASVHLMAGRFADARTHAEAALRLTPDDAEAHIALGEALAGLHDPVHSEPLLLKAVRLAPQSADAHGALGSLYWSLGRLPEAEAALTRAVELAPQQAAGQRRLASFYLETHRDANAERPLDALIALEPQNVPAILQRAQVLAFRGKTDEALAAVDAADRIEPDAPRVMLARAYVLLRQKRVDDGIWWAMRARERHPDDFAPPLRIALAQILEAGGRRKAAEQEYAAVLKTAPRNWVAANNLAWLYAADGRLDEALRFARVASQEAPDRPEVKDTLAVIAKRKGG